MIFLHEEIQKLIDSGEEAIPAGKLKSLLDESHKDRVYIAASDTPSFFEPINDDSYKTQELAEPQERLTAYFDMLVNGDGEPIHVNDDFIIQRIGKVSYGFEKFIPELNKVQSLPSVTWLERNTGDESSRIYNSWMLLKNENLVPHRLSKVEVRLREVLEQRFFRGKSAIPISIED